MRHEGLARQRPPSETAPQSFAPENQPVSNDNALERAEAANDNALEQAEPQEADAEQTPSSRFERFAGKVKEFWRSQIKGEVREKTEIEKEAEAFVPDSVKAVKAGVPALAGAAASLFGVKSLVDVPRYLTQKYFSEQEKGALMEVFTRAEQTRPENGEAKPDAGEAARTEVSGRAAELRSRIEGSKYMTAEKKAELLERLAEIDATHSSEIAGADDARNREFAEALNDSIETRVKGTVALKETLNTMAVASGLSVARGLAFGAVSMYERFQKVTSEMKEGERQGSLFHEMVTKGVQETVKALAFQEGHTRGEKIKNAAEALASVMRVAGMAAVGVNELNQEGVSGAISKAIEGLKHTKITEFVSDNFASNTHHLLKFMGLAGDHGSGHGVEATAGHGAAAAHAAAETSSLHGVAAHAVEGTGGNAGVDLMGHTGAAATLEGASVLSHDTVIASQEAIHLTEAKADVIAETKEKMEGEE
jgi:hypothetical protein